MDRRKMFGFVTRGVAVLLLLASAVGVRAESVDKLPKPTGYVSDFADVLDAGSEAQMESLCEQVDKQAHAQIAVVTIHSLDGESIENFATELEEKWKVGKKGTDRGLLMIFAINDRKQRIEVGYGLEGILNDAKVGDIARSMNPQFAQAQYGPGILGGLQQIANVIAKDANVSLAQTQDEDEAPPQSVHATHHRSNAGSVLRILFFLFVLIMIFKGGGRGGGSGWLWFLAGNMMGGGGGRDRGGWGSGGGDSGGGGGFGGFGGGSSGGGGASSDW